MDLIRLDSTTYLPDALIEGYSSLIWTERYYEPGEFELITSKISDTMDLLPARSLISIMDSDTVMVVENRTIESDSDNVPILKVTGRTFDSFLEHRVQMPDTYNTDWKTVSYRPDEVIAVLIWSYMINTTGKDPFRYGKTIDVYNAVENLYLTQSINNLQNSKVWWMTSGSIYSVISDIQAVSDLGIRVIRPIGSQTIDSVYVDTETTIGRILHQTLSYTEGLRFDIYDGDDRTFNSTTKEPIVFRYDAGDIQEPSYLFSDKNLKNVAYAISDKAKLIVWKDTESTTPPSPQPTGLNVRELFIDIGALGDIATSDVDQSLIQKVLAELAKHNRTTLFDGSISPASSYKYNRDYFLGDKVSLVAQYGFEATMRVAEYIRTEDETGDQGYPTLILVDEEGAI